MSAPNRPCATAMPSARSRSAKYFVEPFALGRRRGGGKARAVAARGVGGEGELADHQRRAAGIGQGEVHLAGVVLEDPAASAILAARASACGVAVALHRADQDQQAGADLADRRRRRPGPRPRSPAGSAPSQLVVPGRVGAGAAHGDRGGRHAELQRRDDLRLGQVGRALPWSSSPARSSPASSPALNVSPAPTVSTTSTRARGDEASRRRASAR